MATSPPTLDTQIRVWRTHLLSRQAIAPEDVDELEDHLRSQVAEFVDRGLTDDEAFLIAVKRMGNLDEVSAQFAQEHSERLWKQLVLNAEQEHQPGRSGWQIPRELVVVVGLGAAAGLSTALGNYLMVTDEDLWIRNIQFIPVIFLIGYLGWKRRISAPTVGVVAAVMLVLVGVLNLYPFSDGTSATLILSVAHVPAVLWCLVGIAYVGGKWRSHTRRMDMVRFTGEWVIYMTLLALGGGVLIGLTFAVLGLANMDFEPLLQTWLLPVAVPGAMLVAAWLVEAKQNVVENITPVLTRIFTPLALLLLLATSGVLLSAGGLIAVDRELLILMDGILLLVLALLLYSASARDPLQPPGIFDLLLTALVTVGIIVDGMALAAMLTRIAEFGFSPNKVAALGLNLLLFGHLLWATWIGIGFLRGRRTFAEQTTWHTRYLPMYGMWAATIIIVLPVVFSFQ